MKIHRLKILPSYFRDVRSGDKNFELRRDDRGFEVGDILELKEWWTNGTMARYTGQVECRQIGYILRDVPEYGLQDGYCILGFAAEKEEANTWNESD